MTEAELWHMQLLAVENTAACLEGTITIVFAYLAAAHFVGPRLTRFQAILASGFFVIAAATSAFLSLVEFRRAAFFMSRLSSQFGVDSISPNYALIPLFAALMALAIPASLFFMYQARRGGRGAPDETPLDHAGTTT